MDIDVQIAALILLGWKKIDPDETHEYCEYVGKRGAPCRRLAILTAPIFKGESRLIEQVCRKHLKDAHGVRGVPRSLYDSFTEWPEDWE